jgi:hypothetical protein
MFDDMNFVTDPLIVEIFLYKNNYKDRLLLAEMKEHARIVAAPFIEENSFFVQASEVFDILHDKFRKDLANFASTSNAEVGKSVTSIYFINNLLSTYQTVKYLKINVSDSPVYSRRVDNKINFDYRIIHSRVDLTSLLVEEDLADIKDLLIEANIIKRDIFDKKPYFEIYARDLLLVLNSFSSNLNEDDEKSQLIKGLISLLGPKIELDNSMLLIIIDA